MTRMHADEIEVDESLVRRLLAAQMPAYADLALTTVEPWGTDHAIWRLGDDLVVRLPRIHWARGQVDLESTWLPRLAPFVPISVPRPVAVGEPAAGYPYRWAVHEWLPGDQATLELIDDVERFARQLVEVVIGLRDAPTDGAPPARNRARPLVEYDSATRAAIHGAHHLIDTVAAERIWESALAADPYDGPPTWVHGDLEGNCLVTDGQLSGLIDWGSACVGDPAVDVQVIWSPLFTERSRAVFVEALQVDDATLARSRGAAINSACAALPYYLDTYPQIVERSRHKLAAVGVDVMVQAATRLRRGRVPGRRDRRVP